MVTCGKRQMCRIKPSRTCQRRATIFLCLLSLAQGVAMVVAGVVVGLHLGTWLKHQLRSDHVGQLYTRFFDPNRAPNYVPWTLVRRNFGNTLYSFGMIVSVVSLLGLAGTVLYCRAVLVLFMIMMLLLMMTETIVSVMILHRETPVNQWGKTSAREVLVDEVKAARGRPSDSRWINSLFLLMVVLDCCGVDGPQDLTHLYTDKYLPETCCTREFVTAAVAIPLEQCRKHAPSGNRQMRGEQYSVGEGRTCEQLVVPDLRACTMTRPDPHSSPHVYKLKGCYDAFFDQLDSFLPWLIPLILSIQVTQMGTLAGAVYVFNKKISGEKDNTPATCATGSGLHSRSSNTNEITLRMDNGTTVDLNESVSP